MICRLIAAIGALLLASVAFAQGTLAMYCSSPDTAWCQGMAIGFEKATGVKVSVTQKATGELFAQIKAEANSPKGDIWWAGPGDAFLQAAEEGLLETYKSPNLDQLHDWARREAEVSQLSRRRRLWGHSRARLQHRDLRTQETARPQMLG